MPVLYFFSVYALAAEQDALVGQLSILFHFPEASSAGHYVSRRKTAVGSTVTQGR